MTRIIRASRPPRPKDNSDKGLREYRSVTEVVGYDVLSLMDIDPTNNFNPDIVYEEHYQMVFMLLELDKDRAHTVATVASVLNRTPKWVAGVVSSDVYQKMKAGGWRPMEYCDNMNMADTVSLDPLTAPKTSSIMEVSVTRGKGGNVSKNMAKTYVVDVEGAL